MSEDFSGESSITDDIGSDSTSTSSVSSSDSSVKAASILDLAQQMHDQYILDGQNEKDRLISEGESRSEEIISDATREATETLVNAKEEADRIVTDAKSLRDRYLMEISRLQAFEADYRQSLTELVASAQVSLERTSIKEDEVMVHTNHHESSESTVINDSFETENEEVEHGDEITTTTPEEGAEVDLVTDVSGKDSAISEHNITEILGDTSEKEELDSL
jgi:cell division protein, divIVA family